MNKEKFESLFKEQLLSDDAHINKELNELFESVLVNCFNGNAGLMDEYIMNLSVSGKPKMTADEENRQAILELTDLFLGGL